MKKDNFLIFSTMYLIGNLFFISGCNLKQDKLDSPTPAITATIFLQSQKPQSQVLVRVPHYRILNGQTYLFGRLYNGQSVLKTEAANIYRDSRNQTVQNWVGDDLSLCDIYYLVDRIEPELDADIYLRTTVTCEIVISGFLDQLRDKATNNKYKQPYIFGPGTYHLKTIRYN